jgi:NTE family protein
LYAAGLSITEIKHIAITKDYNQFKGFSLVCLIRNDNLSSGDIFERWVGKHLAGKRFIDLNRNLPIIATDVKLANPLFLTEQEHLI